MNTQTVKHQRPGLPPSASQLAAARSLPDTADAEWPSVQVRIPASVYLDEAQYRQEQEQFFRRMPIPVAPSVLLPSPGSFVCRDGFPKPIILSRDKTGRVRAMVNVCRHRGARLASESGPAEAATFVCPYHAWSYDLSGRLVRVPREEAFTDLDKSQLGLVQLPCREEAGLIWVTFDPDVAPRALNDDLMTDLTALDLRQMHLFAHRRHEADANWKLIMDTFLEGYHVIRLHSKSLGSLFEDAPVTLDQFGPYLRQTSARKKFVQSMIDQHTDSIDGLRSVVVFVYTLFPCGVLICSPDYVNLLLLKPQGIDKTIVENFMLTNEPPPTQEANDRWQRSLNLTDGLAFPEDFQAASLSQSGLRSGVIDEVIVGGMEEPVGVFHETIKRELASG